jgi:hypothetical protein
MHNPFSFGQPQVAYTGNFNRQLPTGQPGPHQPMQVHNPLNFIQLQTFYAGGFNSQLPADQGLTGGHQSSYGQGMQLYNPFYVQPQASYTGNFNSQSGIMAQAPVAQPFNG